MTTDRMPAAFIGHGSPVNAVADNRYTRAWAELGAALPRPRAILVISAHWYTMHTVVTAMPQPRTIHDTWGFPQEVADKQYPAPGAPDLALEVAELVGPERVAQDLDTWGLDHGTWAVLGNMFPDAGVPVVQLSVNMLQPLDHHFELGTRLAPLRDRGVLVVGSGNIVHNLPRADATRPDHGHPWAHRFDDAARTLLTATPEDVVALRERPEFDDAVPTPDHFIPMLYVAGLGAASNDKAEVVVDGYVGSTISMTSYSLGLGAAA